MMRPSEISAHLSSLGSLGIRVAANLKPLIADGTIARANIVYKQSGMDELAASLTVEPGRVLSASEKAEFYDKIEGVVGGIIKVSRSV